MNEIFKSNCLLCGSPLIYHTETDQGDAKEKEKKIKVARQRAANVLGGFCGFYGACGAGIGTGIFIGIISDSTRFPPKRGGWQTK